MANLRLNWNQLREWEILKDVEEAFLKRVRGVRIFGGNRATGSNQQGQSALFMRDDGLYGIGRNFYGQLGIGVRHDAPVPILITALRGITVQHISTGFGFVIASSASRVFGWGKNNYGQLGLGHNLNRCLPVEIMNLEKSKVKEIACGLGHTLVLDENGNVFAWGMNGSGQCGVSTGEPYVTRPVQVRLPENICAIDCGNSYSVALTTEGQIFGWGMGRTAPSIITDLDVPLEKIVAGSYFLLLLSKEQQLFSQRMKGGETKLLVCNVRTGTQPKMYDIIGSWESDVLIGLTDDGVYTWENRDILMLPKKKGGIEPSTLLYDSVTPGNIRVFGDTEPAMPSSPKMEEPRAVASPAKQQSVQVPKAEPTQNQKPDEVKLRPASPISSLVSESESVAAEEETTAEETPQELLLDLRLFFNDKTHSDIILEVGNEKIFAHTFILKMTCPSFGHLLDGVVRNKPTLKIEERSPEAFVGLVKYLYTGTITLEAIQLLDLMDLAVKYKVHDLNSKVGRVFEEKITVEHAAELYERIRKQNIKSLENQIVKFIINNYTLVFATHGYRNLTPMTAQELVVKVFQGDKGLS